MLFRFCQPKPLTISYCLLYPSLLLTGYLSPSSGKDYSEAWNPACLPVFLRCRIRVLLRELVAQIVILSAQSLTLLLHGCQLSIFLRQLIF